MTSRQALQAGASKLVIAAQMRLRLITRAAHLVCGIGDYDSYLAHWRKAHPGQAPLTYAEFFRARQDARYGQGAARCC